MPRNEQGKSAPVGRREVLAGLGAVTAVAVGGVPTSVLAATPPMPKDFLLASSRLTGIALDASYLDLANAVWNALVQAGTRRLDHVVRVAGEVEDEAALLRRLTETPDRKEVEMTVRAVIFAWYNGWVPDPNDPTATDRVTPVRNPGAYDQALLWRACEEWTKAPGDCGGPFGNWHDQPAGINEVGA